MTMKTKTTTALSSEGIQRYVKLLFLMMAGGAIYPLLYLRQNFELTLLATLDISLAQLNVAHSVLGTSFFSVMFRADGWLTDFHRGHC